jgi:hypothetical protein
MKPILEWPKSPSRTQHRILGPRLRWADKSKRYRIERFPEDGDPVFIILANTGDWRVISHRRRLKSAKLFCQQHLRQTERSIRVRRG